MDRSLPARCIDKLSGEPVEVALAGIDVAQHAQRARAAVLEPNNQCVAIDLDAQSQVILDGPRW